MRRAALAIGALCAACFRPTPPAGLACPDNWCPPPQQCGSDLICHGAGTIDAPPSTACMHGGVFGSKSDYPTATEPVAVIATDLDGNGTTDIVTADLTTEGDVSVLLGDGMGLFAPHAETSVAGEPAALTAADFDGDGKQDLAVAQFKANKVVLLFGTGGGGLGSAMPQMTGLGPYSIATGQFRAGGKPDLAVADGTDPSDIVTVLLNKTINSQLPWQSETVPVGTIPADVVTADVDGDGNLDLVIVGGDGTNNTMAVFYGDGTGAFTAGPATSKVDDVVAGVAVGDLDGDGQLDIAVAFGDMTFGVDIFYNRGNRTFQVAAQPLTLDTVPTAIVVHDFDGDHLADIAVTTDKPALNIFMSNQLPVELATGSAPISLAVGDFNGDKLSDLVVANSLSDTVSVYLFSCLP